MVQELLMPGGERGDRGGRSGGALQRTTGRDRDEWFGVLDAWGAARRPYREIAEWLTGSHGLSAWWAQKLIVEFEEERGLRPTGICSNGTFEVGARKMIAVPAQRAFEALADAGVRNAWLPGVRLDETASEPGRSVGFGAGDGSRVQVELILRGPCKTLVAVRQLRIGDAASAAQTKKHSRQRLTALKTLLEGRR